MDRYDPAARWTEELDTELRLRWREGLSASEIAALAMFRPRTRNSIIGRVHRLKIQGTAPHKTNAPAAKNHVPRVFKPKALPPTKPRPKRVIRAENAPLVEGDRWFCQWIDQKDNLGTAKKCGQPRIRMHGRDQSWCAKHYAACFIGKPVQKPRRHDGARLQSAHFW
jgi:hypothetical protein